MMKVTLEQKDYVAISALVREKLRELVPGNEFSHGDILFGPEFMAPSLRIATPATRVKFDKEQLGYVRFLRKQINESDDSKEEKKRKMQNLESIILFGQILFAQTSCLHFLSKHQYGKPAQNPQEENARAAIEQQLLLLQKLTNKEGIQYSSSKFEALSRRQEFNEHLGTLKQRIKEAPINEDDKQVLLNKLHKARGFYYQANDFNFKYANKPSRSYSNFLNTYEFYGSKVALAASIIAIGATALSFIPVLTPVMGPIAVVASSIALVIGMPLALKNLGTMIYNFVRFGAEPTPNELINAAALGTTLVLSGTGSMIGQAISAGLVGQDAALITQGVTQAVNVGKAAFGVHGQIHGLSSQAKIDLYKAELKKLKGDEAIHMHSPNAIKL